MSSATDKVKIKLGLKKETTSSKTSDLLHKGKDKVKDMAVNVKDEAIVLKKKAQKQADKVTKKSKH